MYIKLDIHAFAREKLCDEQLKSPYGLYGLEVMQPLGRKINYEFEFLYDSQTQVMDVVNAAKTEIWGNDHKDDWTPEVFAFTVQNERYYIADQTKNFGELVEKYLDRNHTGKIILTVLVSCDAGTICNDGVLRYYVHSHEAGKHNEPHIHVRDLGFHYEASVRISDGEIIAGMLPRKLANKAKNKILSDQEFFAHCWNTMTDGLEIDINHHYGYIGY